MTVFLHELRQGRKAFCIWTGAIGFFLAVCVFIFPEMKGEMDALSDTFASMGSFTAAFWMDRLNFGTLIGYYTIECGNVLGLAGAFFAALTGAGLLAKEERGRTADFLLTHPISRRRVISEKLLTLLTEISVLNLVIFLLALGSIAAIGESIPFKDIALLHLAYYLLQLELGAICFGLSAFLRRGSAGVGLGLAGLTYMMNIIANIAPSVEFLKYITPYAFCDGASIVGEGKLDMIKVGIGLVLGALGIAAAYWKYENKDINQ